jgi:hypothetical protein
MSRAPPELALEAERQAEILRETGRVVGGTSGDELAAALRVPVITHAHLPPGIDGVRDTRRFAVVVAAHLRHVARQHTICHELAELHIVKDLPVALQEAFCDHSALAQLLPRFEFLRSLHALGLDVPALAQRWPHAGADGVAARIADVWPGVVTSGWVGVQTAWRCWSDGLRPPRLLRAREEEALGQVYGRAQPSAQLHRAGLTVRAWRTSTLPNRALLVSQVDAESPDRLRHWVDES